MRKFVSMTATALAAGLIMWASDWPSQGGNPQRDGWAKYENGFTKANVGGLELLYTYQSDNRGGLTAPLVDGLLITYRGFKEMLVFGGSSNAVYSVDADLNRLIWKTPLTTTPVPVTHGSCAGGLTAALAMPGSSTGSGRGISSFRRVVRPPSGAAPAAPVNPLPQKPGLLATGFGRIGAFLAVSSDGNLHVLNTSTGDNLIPALAFVPPGANLSALNVSDETLYAATDGDCEGAANGVYAADFSADTPKLSSFLTNGAAPAGTRGTAISKNGKVYTQISSGHGEMAGEYNDTVLALASRTLQPQDYFTPSSAPKSSRKSSGQGATPMIFDWKGRELLVASGGDGSLYLLDSASLGGTDHHQPLSQSAPIGRGFRGAFSSWEDTATRTRWVYALLTGAPAATAKFPLENGQAAHGSVAAFKVEEQEGHPVLVPAWTSHDLIAPAQVIVANGIAFVLSTGDEGKRKSNAVLYALDGSSGKQLFSSQSLIKSFSRDGGLAIANRRIYLTANDNSVYCFGFFADQLQLTGK